MWRSAPPPQAPALPPPAARKVRQRRAQPSVPPARCPGGTCSFLPSLSRPPQVCNELSLTFLRKELRGASEAWDRLPEIVAVRDARPSPVAKTPGLSRKVIATGFWQSRAAFAAN